MTSENSPYPPEPEWEDVYNDPAIRELSRFVPTNSCDFHDEAADERIIKNMREHSAWMNRILAAAMAEE